MRMLTDIEGAGSLRVFILEGQKTAGLFVMTEPQRDAQDHTSSQLQR